MMTQCTYCGSNLHGGVIWRVHDERRYCSLQCFSDSTASHKQQVVATQEQQAVAKVRQNASSILEKAAGHLKDRAATYDKDGERSVPPTVEAFNAITGHKITPEQGWLFMALLKATRSQQGEYRADSYEDGAAFFALAGEQASKDRG